MRTQDQETPAVAKFARFMEAQDGGVWGTKQPVDLESVPLVGETKIRQGKKRGDFEPGPDTNKTLEREKSGFYTVGLGRNVQGPEERLEENKKMHIRELYAGFSLSVRKTLEEMHDISSFMFNQAKFHALDVVKDMASYGGKRIETLEEKLKIEGEKKICIGGFTVEEVTEVRGRLVSAEEYHNNNAITAMIGEIRQTAKDLKEGKIEPTDLSPEMADRLKFWSENGKEIIDIMNNPGQYGPLGDMKVRQAMLQIMGDDMPYPESYRNPKIIFGGAPQAATPSAQAPRMGDVRTDTMPGNAPALTLYELHPHS